MTLSAHEELDQLHERSARVLANGLAGIQLARLRGDTELEGTLLRKLGADLGGLLAGADLLGRRRLLLEISASGESIDEAPVLSAGDRVTLFAAPKVPFLESIEAILARNPVLAEGWEAIREAWAQRGFALARSTSVTVTRKVRAIFVSSLRGGLNEADAVESIQRSLGEGPSITKAYADTVFRTITSSAYAEGRQAQSSRPAVRRAASGWRYVATLDSDVRDNHLAGDEFVAHVDDPVWEIHAPPNGYNCRCALEIVATPEMVSLGLSHPDGSLATLQTTPIGFVPDRGFTARGSLFG